MFDNLTNEELITRLAKIEQLGKETAARIASGEYSPIYNQGMSRGRWVSLTQLETALNWQRTAWQDTRQALRARNI